MAPVKTKLALLLVMVGLAAGGWAGWSRPADDGHFRRPGPGPYESLRPLLRGEPRAQFFADVGSETSALLEAQYTLAPILLIPCLDVEVVQERLVAGCPLICHVKDPEILNTWIDYLEERARERELSLDVVRTAPGPVLVRMRRP